MNKKSTCYQDTLAHFIDLSSKDSTASIAKAHGLMGLTRLNLCMQKIGLDITENYLIALPDYTYTRNAFRWSAGFPYGCIIHTNQKESFIPTDFHPNCCGVIVAEIPKQGYDIINIRDKYCEKK